jgi:hypothetical protein
MAFMLHDKNGKRTASKHMPDKGMGLNLTF